MKGRNNLAISAVLVALLVLAVAVIFLWPRPVGEPMVGQAPSGTATTPPVAEQKPADTPTSAEEEKTAEDQTESPSAADKAEGVTAPADEKAADASSPRTDEAADASSPEAGKAEDAREPEPGAAGGPVQPSFDVVRIEPTGDGVIAGRAEPGWRIIVESGDVQVAMADVDDQGEWTVILDRPLSPGAHTLSLQATSPDGKARSSSKQTVSAEVATPPTKTAVAETPKQQPAGAPTVEPAPADISPIPRPPAPEPVPEEHDLAPGRVAPGTAPPLPQTASIQEGKATPPSSLPHQDRPGTYTILPGDTLWDIAQRYLGAGWRYKTIYRDNRKIIRNPNLIYPEQQMNIAEPPSDPN